jgi:tetratricopeptide repeat protein
MTVGLPGTGIGGMFYLLSALAMPVREAYRQARGVTARCGWRVVLGQTAIAGGILAGMWVTSWLLGLAPRATDAPVSQGAPHQGHALFGLALALCVGTLAAVLTGVELLRLWIRRGAIPSLCERRVLVAAIAVATAAGPRNAAAQNPGHDEASSWYDAALRLAPGERDAVIGRARVLAQASRTDAAILAYERWLALYPKDAEAWSELARERLRRGRPADAARALERAQALAPDGATARRLALVRAAAAAAVTPLASGSRDSDGNTTLRVGAAAELAASAGRAGDTRFGAEASRTRVGDGFTTAVLDQFLLRAAWRPRAVLRVDAAGGATRLDAAGGAGATIVPIGRLRARWRAPAAGPAVDLGVRRSVLDATPRLVANPVMRTELGAMVDLPVAPSVRLRGIGRTVALAAAAELNHRTALTGAVAVAAAPGVELSGQFHQVRYARPSAAGYFAPRLAQVMEAGTSLELETLRPVLVAVDAGLGVQRVANFGAARGPWRRALRLYSLIVVPLAPGRDLRLELEGDDSPIADEAATGRWRYGSAAVSLRWAVR